MCCQAEEDVEGVLQIVQRSDAEGFLTGRAFRHEIWLRTSDLHCLLRKLLKHA
jgi:hypothetical protein